VVGKVRAVWAAILKADIAADTDFFGAGAGSMDVVRLELLKGTVTLSERRQVRIV
jgi:hypothetical protein